MHFFLPAVLYGRAFSMASCLARLAATKTRLKYDDYMMQCTICIRMLMCAYTSAKDLVQTCEPAMPASGLGYYEMLFSTISKSFSRYSLIHRAVRSSIFYSMPVNR